MSIVPIVHIGSAFGIMVLFALTMNSWFFTKTFLPPNILWEDVFKIIHKDTELEFKTSANYGWLKGMKWDMTLKAKLPCTEDEEMIDELSQADEDKSFKLLDQLHSTILFREREQIIGSKHALGHLLRLENSAIFSSEEIDFKKLCGEMSWFFNINGPMMKISNDSRKIIPKGKTLILKLKISQGKLKYQELDSAESFELFQRAYNSTMLPEKTNGSLGLEYGEGRRMFWLDDSDSTHFTTSEIDFMKSQLKTGVFLSMKVIGSESKNEIDYKLNKLNGNRENCTYRFSSNLYIDSEAGYSQDLEHRKPNVIRIPRGHPKNEKINYPWYNFIQFFRFLFSTPASTRIDNFCLTYERGIKGDGDILLPKAIVSFLICY